MRMGVTEAGQWGYLHWTLLDLQGWVHLRERYNDEKGPIDALVLHEVRDECNSLDGLSQAHFIGQDAIQVVVV